MEGSVTFQIVLLYLGTLLTAALIAAASTPIFMRLARASGLVVQPSAERWHTQPTPLLGGGAIALGALAAGLAVLGEPGWAPGMVVLSCAGLAFALGLLDDFRHLAPSTKLVGQVLIGSALAVGGVRVELITFAPAAFALTIIWVVAVMNAVNLMDNMDGLAAGVVAISAAVLGVLAVRTNPAATVIAMATAGAAAGFLVHNRYPARVFMGDAGSMFLGFLVAANALLFTASGAATLGLTIIAPLAALALPLFDTVLVAAARGLSGRKIAQGGRDHTSHRLAALGLSDAEAVWLLYLLALAFGALGLALEALAGVAVPLLVVAFVGLGLFGVFLMDVDVHRPRVRSRRSVFDQALTVRVRFAGEVGLDLVLLTTAYYLAYVLRFEGVAASVWMTQFVQSVPLVVGAQLAALLVVRAYRTLWRYLSVSDVVTLVRAASLGSVAAAVAIVIAFRFEGHSRGVIVLDWLLVVVLLVGSRSFLLWLRHWFALRPRADEVRALVVGANDGGSLALRLLAQSTRAAYRVVGFLDDDPGKLFRHVGGVSVIGSTQELSEKVAEHEVGLVVVALDPAEEHLRERIQSACRAAGVECRELLIPV